MEVSVEEHLWGRCVWVGMYHKRDDSSFDICLVYWSGVKVRGGMGFDSDTTGQ